jgi:hypothetical protein
LEAVQDVAFDADQLRVAVPPEATDVESALIITTVAGVLPMTVTVALLDVVPPLPVHANV